MSVAGIRSGNGSITLVINGKPHLVGASHPHYNEIDKGLGRLSEAELLHLVDVKEGIKVKSGGRLQVKGDTIYFGNEPLRGNFPARIMEMIEKGLDVAYQLKFLDNLMDNPDSRCVAETYRFTELKGFPVTDDGCFLAYKSVRQNWNDWKFDTINNGVGRTVEVRRNTVDSDWGKACSNGLHVGSLNYVRSFHFDEGRVLIVKVNPKDVVSVPSTTEEKIRVCKYVVVAEMDKKTATELMEPLYRAAPETGVSPVVASAGRFDNSTNDFWNRPRDLSDVFADDLAEHIAIDDDYEDDDNEYDDQCGVDESWGVKPSGTRFHNVRGPDGRFAKRG